MLSPSAIAQISGATPRWRGSSDGWKLTAGPSSAASSLAEQLRVVDGEQELGTVPGDRRDRGVVVDVERREYRDPASDGMALQRRLPGVVDAPGRDDGEDVARRHGLEQDVEHEAGRLVVPGQQDATHATDGRSMHPQ
jgi:hypothetical protein